MNWKYGYFAETGYAYGHYPETMPARLRWAALLQGQLLPEKDFRYLDAGCGQGLNLILAATCHPDSEFIGIDFSPEHIAHASALARRCGLTNVRFIEGDFVALADDPGTLGEFDYVVCHGISTWIAPPVRKQLFRLVGHCLKPGGLFYNSYNTHPGWLAVLPFQHLVLLEQRSRTGAQALQAALTSMASLKDISGGMFSQLPGLQNRLDNMKTHDAAYLLHEYNNQCWQPLFVTQMLDEMAAIKLDYLGTATLPELFDDAFPAPLREWLAQQDNPAIKEQLRDYALNQSFRRDLYVKGRLRPWSKAHQPLLQAQRFMINSLAVQPEPGQTWPIRGGSVELNGEAGFYADLMQCLALAGEAGLSLGELMDGQTNAAYRNHVTQVISMLVHGNWATPCLAQTDDIRRSARMTNTALCQSILEGAPYRYICLPKAGYAMTLGDFDWQMINFELTELPETQWPQALVQTGRELLKDGQPITDPAQVNQLLEIATQEFVKTKRPYLRNMGAY
jgi:SAM-dependent methyltransferase